MKMNGNSVRTSLLLTRLLAVPLTLGLALSGCSNSPSTPAIGDPGTQAKNAGNFTTTVFLGDSLTAGFQNSSLLDTQQVNGWAPLVAQQAKFPVTLPLIAAPGAPNQLTLVHLASPPLLSTIGTQSGVTTGRDNPTTQVTDLAVPGAVLNDVLNTAPVAIPTTGQQTITELVLGFPGLGIGQDLSQAQFASRANPTTIFLWIGNNDALVADFVGSPSAMTPLATFTTQYQQLISYLTTKTNAHLVIANVPDVTAVAYMQSAAVLLGFFSQQTGVPAAAIGAALGIAPGDLVALPGVQQIPGILGGTVKGQIASVNILHAADVVTVQANVAAYNKVIAASASAAGATLVDINALFAQTTASGVTANGVTGNTGFLGGVFSLDGIHPTNTGYAVVANKFIDTMNAAFKTTIPDVNVASIAAVDPLFPPYPGHKSIGSPVLPMQMPTVHLSAERVRELLGRPE